MIIEWLNTLCPRLQHLLQIRFQKEYIYNFSFASQATNNSVQMMDRQRSGHFEPLNPPAVAEVITSVNVGKDDESTLIKMIESWEKSPQHTNVLRNNNSLGIGFAYDLGTNVIYTTIRLGK
ncbi:MAG TPA: CAP domain-containing protein [Candidatus Nanoarchaeia archaeon]|nr:CAP domain-containing protein [Candidatus Nanoarchaeia archaeon]